MRVADFVQHRWRAVLTALVVTLAGACLALGHGLHGASADRAMATAMASTQAPVPTDPAHSTPSGSDDHCDASRAATCGLRVGLDVAGLLLVALVASRLRPLLDAAMASDDPVPHDGSRRRRDVVAPIVSGGAVGLLCVCRT